MENLEYIIIALVVALAAILYAFNRNSELNEAKDELLEFENKNGKLRTDIQMIANEFEET